MQEKPIHNKYNGNKNTKNKNFNRHRSTHKNYKNTKHNKMEVNYEGRGITD